ncbi:phage tail protein [Pseudomonas sp.]|uniref:phage tail protein n=1 Tax=Pseudomonas sp. TaxID=306 RepID=UPI0028AB3187|nr:phage tail protein [Pseudomonas sp.]
MKALLQGLAAFGLSARSAYVGDLDGLRGTAFFGYSNNSLGSEDTGGGYDAVGFQIEGPGQRTQFGVTTGSKVAVRTDDSTDYSGFTPWVELATVEALKALEARDVGLVGFFAMPTPPPGWLKRNGAAVSRTTYAALFARIGTTFGAGDGSTTFNLPDARGSFDRGWDDGRNLDKGRAFGSDQGPANLSHVHGTTVSTDGAHVHTSTFTREKITSNFVQEGGNAVFGDQESDGYQTVSTSSGGAHKHSVIIAASGESEARPYNTAYLPCIKY